MSSLVRPIANVKLLLTRLTVDTFAMGLNAWAQLMSLLHESGRVTRNRVQPISNFSKENGEKKLIQPYKELISQFGTLKTAMSGVAPLCHGNT